MKNFLINFQKPIDICEKMSIIYNVVAIVTAFAGVAELADAHV
jgi:hypothetical protein